MFRFPGVERGGMVCSSCFLARAVCVLEGGPLRGVGKARDLGGVLFIIFNYIFIKKAV